MWPMGHMRPNKLLCESLMQILFWSQNVAWQNGWNKFFEFTGLKVVCHGTEGPEVLLTGSDIFN